MLTLGIASYCTLRSGLEISSLASWHFDARCAILLFSRGHPSVNMPVQDPVLPQLLLQFQREEISLAKSASSRLKMFFTTDGDHKVQVSFLMNWRCPAHLLHF